MPLVLTPSLFYQYAACPHWIWYDRFGDPARKGEMPELAQKLMEQGVLHEQEYVKGLSMHEVLTEDPKPAVAETLALMRAGTELIYQGTIEVVCDGVVWRGKPDFLEKRSGKSVFGAWHYVPVDIKSSHSVHDQHKLQLGFYALILRELQGRTPKEAAIITIEQERIAVPITRALAEKTRRKAAEILRIIEGEKPPLKLSTKCRYSPWFQECVRAAEEAHDVALIYNVHQSTLTALRAAGIRTVADAAHMNIENLPKMPHGGPAALHRIKLQAQALEERTLKWIGTPDIPEAPLKLYFDIEGDPLLDVQYLFGFWVMGSGDSEGNYRPFLAEKPEDEGKMWRAFLRWIETLPEEYVVYHYAPYEKTQLARLAERYGGSPALERFSARLVDLARVVRDTVIFPTYFYSIKNLAKSEFLGYRWRHAKAGGAQSIFWYERWLETGDRSILQDIVDYNEDDVIATHWLHRWLKKQSV